MRFQHLFISFHKKCPELILRIGIGADPGIYFNILVLTKMKMKIKSAN